MLTAEEIKLCSKIMEEVSNPKTCGTLGTSFCRVPSAVITALRANGFTVRFINPQDIPDMDNGREFHNILVERKTN